MDRDNNNEEQMLSSIVSSVNGKTASIIKLPTF